MNYTEETHITTVAEVNNFFIHIYKELKLNWHPDDDFVYYFINNMQSQVSLYNRLSDECFDVCKFRWQHLCRKALERYYV